MVVNSVAPHPPPRRPLSAFLQTLMGPALEPLADGELLTRFAAERDEAAFAHLVRRHGPMVLAVARRVLGHDADAEDVGQAVFLLLARQAHRFGRTAQVGGWLHAVATRTAWKARTRRARQRRREAKAARPVAIPPELPDELPALVDRALQTLPAKYRDAVILCDLEGVPRQVAADRLGVPLGTLSSRLATAHAKLAHRLSWPLPTIAAALTGGAAEGLAHATLFTLAVSPTRLATGAVATLVLEVSRAMLWTKIKVAVTVAFVAAAATGGGVAVSRYAAAGDGGKAGITPTTAAGKPVEREKATPAPAVEPAADFVKRNELIAAEMAKFKGEWAFESASRDGKPVGADDFKKWRMRFDAAADGVGVVTIVPEPGSARDAEPAEIELEKARAKPAPPEQAKPPAATPAGDASARKRAIDAEAAKFVGTWNIASATVDGVPPEKVDKTAFAAQWTFDDSGEIRWTVPKTETETRQTVYGEYRVYPHRDPRQINLVFGYTKGMSFRAHYEFTADGLRLACFDPDKDSVGVPRGFTVAEQPKGSPKLWVFNLKRSRPGDEPPAAKPPEAVPSPRPAATAAQKEAERILADREELARFKGSWVSTLRSKEGGPFVPAEGVAIEFDDTGRVALQTRLGGFGPMAVIGSGDQILSGRYRLPRSLRPKRLTMVFEGRTPLSWPVVNAAYEFDGDTLKLTPDESDERPADAPPTVWVLKRVTPAGGRKAKAAAPVDGRAEAVKAEREKITGRWSVEGVTSNGTPRPLTQAERDAVYIIYRLGNVMLTTRQELQAMTLNRESPGGQFRLDPFARPKRFQLVGAGYNRLPDMAAVYELGGDTLRLAYFAAAPDDPAEFPTGFTQREPGRELRVMTLKRLPPDPDAKPEPKEDARAAADEHYRRESLAYAVRVARANVKEDARIRDSFRATGTDSSWLTASQMQAQKNLAEAELALCETDPERVAVLTRSVAEMRRLEAEVTARTPADPSAEGKRHFVRLLRLDGEIELEQARAKRDDARQPPTAAAKAERQRRLDALAAERAAAAERLAKIPRPKAASAPADPSPLWGVRRDIARAELDLAETPAERVAVLEKLAKLAADAEADAAALKPEAQAAAKAERVAAEAELQKARGK